MDSEWKKVGALLPLARVALQKCIETLEKGIITPRLADTFLKIIRFIAELEGKLIKKEIKLDLKQEEKHIYLHFDDPVKELKYHKDIIDIHSERMKELKEGKS